MAQQFQTVAVPKRVQLVSQLENRTGDGDKDAKLVNCYVEQEPGSNEYWIVKRPGFNGGYFTPGFGENVGRGIYNIQKSSTATDKVIWIAGSNIYANITSPTLIGNTSTTYPTTARFTTVNYTGIGGATRVAVFGSTSGNAYFTDGATVTQITDVDFPAQRVLGWAFLDDTLYTMTPEGLIYGSGIADLTSWSALNVIAARDEGDFGVGIARYRNYVVALKQWTIEFFYDAGNPSGSPLSRVTGAKLSVGCLHGNTVREIDGDLIWVGTNRGARPMVVKLNGLQPEIISTPAVERRLATGAFSFSGDTWFSSAVRVGGHRFYVLTSTIGNFTLAYDLDMKLWFDWTNASGSGKWPVIGTSFAAANSPLGTIVCQVAQTDTAGLGLVAPDYFVDNLGRRYCTDDNVPVPVSIVTSNHDFGTVRNKQLAAMYVVADSLPGSILEIRHTDDDYQNWSNFRPVDLNSDQPVLQDCGSFSQRAWHLRHVCNTPFRISNVDLQFDIGTI